MEGSIIMERGAEQTKRAPWMSGRMGLREDEIKEEMQITILKGRPFPLELRTTVCTSVYAHF